MKYLRPGKVVIVTSGRYAGRKAVIMESSSKKSQHAPYGRSLICGLRKYPKRVTRRMSKRTILRRSRLSVFLRVMNFKHFLPTRYNLELPARLYRELNVSNSFKVVKSRKMMQKALLSRYNSGCNRWFYEPLKF